MIAAYHGLFQGDLAPLGERLVLCDHRPSRGVANELGNPAYMHDTLQCYGAKYGEPDIRGGVTQWSKLYFARFTPPVLLVNVVLGIALPTGLGRVGVELSVDGCPDTFVLTISVALS